MDYEKFVNQQNALTIDEEPAICYQLVSHNSDEVWDTLPWPSEPDVVGEHIRELADSFPMGRHHIRLQVVTRAKTVRAQLLIPIEGRQSAANTRKAPADDSLTMSRALRANVETSEQQLSSMMARLEAEGTRNARLEDELIASKTTSFEMLTMMHDIVSKREEAQMRMAEHAARMAQIASFGERVAPVLLPVVGAVVQYFGAKFEKFVQEQERQEAAKKTPPEPATEAPQDLQN